MMHDDAITSKFVSGSSKNILSATVERAICLIIADNQPLIAGRSAAVEMMTNFSNREKRGQNSSFCVKTRKFRAILARIADLELWSASSGLPAPWVAWHSWRELFLIDYASRRRLSCIGKFQCFILVLGIISCRISFATSNKSLLNLCSWIRFCAF